MMKKIKQKNPTFKTEFFVNPILSVIFLVLFILNALEINFLELTINLRVLYGILLFVLFLFFVFKSIVNLMYKVEITANFIAFFYPTKKYNRRLLIADITEYRFKTNRTKDDTLILFLKGAEVAKLGLKRYSSEQRKEIIQEIKARGGLK